MIFKSKILIFKDIQKDKLEGYLFKKNAQHSYDFVIYFLGQKRNTRKYDFAV